LKKTSLLIIGFELIIGLLFYLLFRPTILLFTLLQIKLEPLKNIPNSILLDSFPSFLSGSITLIFLRLITINYKTNLNHLLFLTILLNILTEFMQLFFSKYTTPDVWDILFGIIGAILSFLIVTNLQSAKIETQN